VPSRWPLARRARGHRGAGARRGEPRGDRFGLLLLLLIVAYLLSAFVAGGYVSVIQIVLFLAVTTLAIRSGQVGRRTARLVITVAVGGSAFAITLALTHSADASAAVANLWAAMMLLFGVVLIVRRVLAQPTVTLQSIFGAISAYMIIGLMFAAVFSAMNKFGNGTFFAGGRTGNVKTFQYFSFTTLTTLGYGDYTAAGSGGQAVAVIEAMLGQIFLATLVARLVAAFRPGSGSGGGSGGRARRAGPWPRGRPARPGRAGSRPRPAPAGARRIASRGRARPARRSPPHPGR
jgi:Ion channel